MLVALSVWFWTSFMSHKIILHDFISFKIKHTCNPLSRHNACDNLSKFLRHYQPKPVGVLVAINPWDGWLINTNYGFQETLSDILLFCSQYLDLNEIAKDDPEFREDFLLADGSLPCRVCDSDCTTCEGPSESDCTRCPIEKSLNHGKTCAENIINTSASKNMYIRSVSAPSSDYLRPYNENHSCVIWNLE